MITLKDKNLNMKQITQLCVKRGNSVELPQLALLANQYTKLIGIAENCTFDEKCLGVLIPHNGSKSECMFT